MASLKNIVDLPVAESVENATLVVVEGGVAKQVPASEVGAQADWDEVDETSPAFIKNKPDLSSVGSGSGGGCYVYNAGNIPTVGYIEVSSDEDMSDMQAYSNLFYERFISGNIRLKFNDSNSETFLVGTVMSYSVGNDSVSLTVVNPSYRNVEEMNVGNLLPYDPTYSAS